MTNMFSRQLGELTGGDQVASIYDDSTEDLRVLAPFLRDGLRLGEKCLCVGDDADKADLMKALHSLGVDTGESLGRGDLVFLSTRAFAKAIGELSPKSALDYIDQIKSEAIQAGHSRLRVACQMHWMSGLPRSNEIVMEFGRLLNGISFRRNIKALFSYRMADFDLAQIGDVIRTMPLIYLKAVPCSNHYFEPPELWLLPTEEASQTIKTLRAKCWIERLKKSQSMGSDSQMVAGIAHAINNHLSILIGYSELLLLQRSDAGPATDMLREIRDAGKASAILTKQLLEIGRKQTGAAEVGGENNDRN
jgi:signal transduction histidine kinase